jgi:hypothetical protein
MQQHHSGSSRGDALVHNHIIAQTLESTACEADAVGAVQPSTTGGNRVH